MFLTHKLGAMYAAETGFKLASNPDTVLAPDIAFIRGPVDDSSESDGDGAPDLVVEVQSPNGRKAKVEEKAARWLALGAIRRLADRSKGETSPKFICRMMSRKL